MTWFDLKPIDLINALIVPVVLTVLLGGWLALITANLIYIREAKARFASFFFDLQSHLFDIKPTVAAAYPLDIAIWFKEIVFLNEDLRRRGFVKLAEVVENRRVSILTEITQLFWQIQNSVFVEGLEDGLRGAQIAEGRSRVCNNFKIEAAKRLARRITADANMVLQAENEWGAILELPAFAAFIERNGLGRRSDCDGKCGNCNRTI